MACEKALKLRCVVQTYHWGKPGSLSTVAKLAQNDPEFQLQEDTTYAEYWMGTHPKGPSTFTDSDVGKQSLDDWINKHPEVLGEEVLKEFDGHLPFLFKVLSVNKTLSIQAHPNLQLAAKLHREKPSNYPDSNHKPEMAIALTEFEGLCGFRSFCEVAAFLETIPELSIVVGLQESSIFISACKENKDENIKRECFKKCFSALVTRDTNVVKQSLSHLVDRLTAMTQDGSPFLKELLLRLNSQFPGDVGCFCIYFLNNLVLSPGQAMFLGPNVPHAYLAGDCMECMACSDNTVRAGLTPKYRDVETLCEMLDYAPGTKEDNMFKSKVDSSCPFTQIYDPPVKDFTVRKIEVPPKELNYTIQPLNGPSIIIVIKGDGHTNSQPRIDISPGATIFSPAKHSLTINCNGNGMLIFQAYCQIS